ncbi:hypothetical protein RND71_018059 [Anisodus tanguticus]|uniref:Membrane protein of ER body-like protein n=1 Tax=Anisodus tanguticus TaxID=243964 RepID=A0AAE1S3G1_9SOLA|nr:hypothetical protein RND71_018059 [Anisodus tanguticus]
MEKVDLKWEQNEVEVEEEEVSVQVRSSKVNKKRTKRKTKTNGHPNSSPKITNGTEKSDLGDEQERSEEKLSDSNNEVEVEVEEGNEQKEVPVQQIVVSNNGVEEGTEKSDLGDEQERSAEHLSASNNGVEVEEATEQKEVSFQKIVSSNNGVEEGTEKSDLGSEQERSKEQLSDSTNGVEVGEEQIVVLNNGVEVEEGTEKYDLGDEQEKSEEHLSDSNNGIEEVTKKSDLGDEQERSEEHISVSSNGAEEGAEPKKKSVQQIVVSNNGVEVEEGTEQKEESVQQIVALNNGVEEGTGQKEESVQQILASNNGVEEGIEAKDESKQQLVTSTNGVEEGTNAEEESKEQILASNNGVEEGTEFKKESKQHLVTSTDGVEEETEAGKGPFKSGHSIYYENDEDCNFISTPSIKETIKLNGYLKSDNLSSSSAQPSKDLLEYHSIVRKSTAIDEIEGAETDLINDSDSDVKGFDVENVIQKQNTHDLYCPNCKSCITRRVILRKRKRKIRMPGDDVKRNKLEVVADSNVDARHAQTTDDEVRDGANSSLDSTPPLAADEYQPDREPEIFRCLSCLSFFIPAGKNWFTSIFALDKGKSSVEQVLVIACREKISEQRLYNEERHLKSSHSVQTDGFSHAGNGIWVNAMKHDSRVLLPSDNLEHQSAKSLVIKDSAPPAHSSSEISREAGGNILGSQNQDAKMKGKMVIDRVGKSGNATKSQEGGSVLDIFEVETRNQPNASASSTEVQGNDRNHELLRTAGGIQVSNGNLVQESVPASNDRKDELLKNGGKIQVSNGNLVLDSVPPSQQNELNLLITSTKEESLTIEKSENHSKSEEAILNKGPDNESLLSSVTTTFANGLYGNRKPNFLTEIPQEQEQLIEAMLPSEALVERNDKKFQSLVENSDNKFESLMENGDNKFQSLVENSDNKFQLSSNDGAHHYEVSQHTITKTNIEIHSNQPLNIDQGALISSVKDALSIQDKPDNITNISVGAAANSIAGNDTIINVEAAPETTETTSANLDTQIQEGQGTDAAEEYKIEIVKSIIFGGLAESITSLSVVSSATGGDTTTLNIFVLAMANLVGGLFFIFHNLWELKRDRYEQPSNQIMEKHVDRYRQQLGRRENFTVHAVLVVLSYIIFGLVPPVIYGFSFRKSDDKELKIVAVAAASLVCILMLSTGKAYVQRAPKPYFKTISAYVILAFTVSGVSYAAGILFKRLMEKLGLFESSSTVNLLLEMPGSGSAWASL